MKYFLFVLIISLSSCGWSAKERMVEVKHIDNKIDTISVYTHHFEIDNDEDLWAVRSKLDGGTFVISRNVKSYKILR